MLPSKTYGGIFKKASNGCYLIEDRSSRQLVTIKIVRNEFSHLKEELYFLDLRPPPLLGILFLPHEPIKTAAAISPIGLVRPPQMTDKAQPDSHFPAPF